MDLPERRSMQMTPLRLDRGTFATRGSRRLVRVCTFALACLCLFFLSSLFLSLHPPISFACGSSTFARGTGSPSFYFRIRDALVCYLSSTLTSLLAAIILINISPIGRREEGLHPIPRSLTGHSFPLVPSLCLFFLRPAHPRFGLAWMQQAG